MHTEVQTSWLSGEATDQKWGPLPLNLLLRDDHLLSCSSPSLALAEATGGCGSASLHPSPVLQCVSTQLNEEISCGALPYILPWKGVTTQSRNDSGSRGTYVKETWSLVPPCGSNAP